MPPTPTDRDLADLAELVLAVARDLQSPRARADGVPTLTPTETAVIRYLHGHPGASPSAVAEATGLQRSNLSTTLRSLEGKGLVERTHDERDRRAVVLRPTAQAADDIARLRRQWADRLGGALGGDADGVAEATALLDRLERRLGPSA